KLAAESLMHDLLSDSPASLGDLAARNPVPNPETLWEWLVVSGRYFHRSGKRLVVVLDRVDHVRTERRASEHLSPLPSPPPPPPRPPTRPRPACHPLRAPAPAGDVRLPTKPLPVGRGEHGPEFPRLDERATELWLVKFLRRTPAPDKRPRWSFSGQRGEFAAA